MSKEQPRRARRRAYRATAPTRHSRRPRLAKRWAWNARSPRLALEQTMTKRKSSDRGERVQQSVVDRITVALIRNAAEDLQKLQDRTSLSKTDLSPTARSRCMSSSMPSSTLATIFSSMTGTQGRLAQSCCFNVPTLQNLPAQRGSLTGSLGTRTNQNMRTAGRVQARVQARISVPVMAAARQVGACLLRREDQVEGRRPPKIV